jgi:hypothetical protein
MGLFLFSLCLAILHWPNIARTHSGALVLVYRECMGHSPFPFSRLPVRRSLDGGYTWSDRNMWRSSDEGLTCSPPEDLSLDRVGIVPQRTLLRDGRILLGSQIQGK